jgi:two-component system NarL family response regulator
MTRSLRETLTRVLLVEHRHLQREGLGIIVEREPGMCVVAEARSAGEARDLASVHQPQVAVVSAFLPKRQTIGIIRRIGAESPGTAVIALLDSGQPGLEGELHDAGAVHCLRGNFSAADLIGAIRRAACEAGNEARAPEKAGSDWRGGSKSGPQKLAAARLTHREREVLGLLADGWSTRRIAEHLHISVKTVETHRANLSTKLELRSLADLTKFAVLAGLTSLEQ